MSLMKQTYGETEFLTLSPDEFGVSVEEGESWLTRFERSERDCMIGAWVNGALAGMVSVRSCGDARRIRHRARLGISVLKEFWGRGVGSMLMDAAIQTAQSAGYRQLELEAAADNDRAIRLYERFGFETYGRCPRALRRENGFADEIEMVKFLK